MILIGVPLTTIIQCLGERRRPTQQFFRDAIVKRSLRHGKRKSFWPWAWLKRSSGLTVIRPEWSFRDTRFDRTAPASER